MSEPRNGDRSIAHGLIQAGYVGALAVGVLVWLWTRDLTAAGLAFGGLTVLVTAIHLSYILRRKIQAGRRGDR